MAKRRSRGELMNQQIDRHLSQHTAGDTRLMEVTGYSSVGPSGPQMTMSRGAGRSITVSGGERYPPGGIVMSSRAGGNAFTQPAAVAPKSIQPNKVSQQFTYDPTSLLDL